MKSYSTNLNFPEIRRRTWANYHMKLFNPKLWEFWGDSLSQLPFGVFGRVRSRWNLTRYSLQDLGLCKAGALEPTGKSHPVGNLKNLRDRVYDGASNQAMLIFNKKNLQRKFNMELKQMP